MLVISCSGCGKELKVRDELAGKRVRCPHCAQPVTVTPGPAKREEAAGSGQNPRDAVTVATREQTPPGQAETAGSDILRSGTLPEGAAADVARELTGFLRPAQGPGELGR